MMIYFATISREVLALLHFSAKLILARRQGGPAARGSI